jgi:hypothetical protein
VAVPERQPVPFPPTLADLVGLVPLAPLGPGTPERSLETRLANLGDAAFGDSIADPTMVQACRAGLWLAFNFLDEAHTISQELSTPEGSYWHALMHRREPDHANAAYWFRRVGTHPVYTPLRAAAADLAVSVPPQAAFLARQEPWDPFAFNHLCEMSHPETAACHDLCCQVQRVEWELLFNHCYRHAIGAG